MDIKILHLVGVSLFLGNIVVSAVWKSLADRSRQLEVMRFGVRLVNLTDLIFTGGGIALLLVSGHMMAARHGGIAANEWIWLSYLLLSASGLIWVALLLPIQIRQARLLRGETIPDSYWPLARTWAIAGTIATILPWPALILMINKA